MSNAFFYLSRTAEETLLKHPERAFEEFAPHVLHSYSVDEPESEIRVECVLCYSARHLHLFVRSSQKELANRDRAYQNGDGFHFVLAAPKPDGGPADEFHVIAVSPLDNTWRRKFVWYRNVDTAFTRLSDTEVRHVQIDGFHYFVVAIPWHEIEPLKPFLFSEYGFNIGYVQAVGQGQNVYMLCDDPKIQWEQSARRYRLFRFEEPHDPEEFEWSIALSSKHLPVGGDLSVELALVSRDDCEARITIAVDAGAETVRTLPLASGLNRLSIPLAAGSLAEGEHQLKLELAVEDSTAEETMSFYLYNDQRLERIWELINRLLAEPGERCHRISAETLAFRCLELRTKVQKLKPYESFAAVAGAIEELETDVERVASGEHLIKTGEKLRLAFRSRQDNTLQPFSLYVPARLRQNPDLIVYLHGSGDDDRSVFNSPMLTRLAEDTGTVLAAPKARGTSHAYAPHAALEDIVEVTELAQSLFATNRTILTGFSMGGYGVLRAYDYCSRLFDALAVISGHPNLANQWAAAVREAAPDNHALAWALEQHPNYCETESLQRFAGVPIIVFHGREDRNCAYSAVEPFLQKLRELNPHSEIQVSDGIGHSGLTEDWYQQLLHWLKTLN